MHVTVWLHKTKAFVSGGTQDKFFFSAHKNRYGHGRTGRSGCYGPAGFVTNHPADYPVFDEALSEIIKFAGLGLVPEVGHVLVYSFPRLLDSCVEHVPLPRDVLSWDTMGIKFFQDFL